MGDFRVPDVTEQGTRGGGTRAARSPHTPKDSFWLQPVRSLCYLTEGPAMPKGKVVSCLQAVLLLPRLSTDHGWWHWPRFLSAFLIQGEDTCEPKTSAWGPLFSRYHLVQADSVQAAANQSHPERATGQLLSQECPPDLRSPWCCSHFTHICLQGFPFASIPQTPIPPTGTPCQS